MGTGLPPLLDSTFTPTKAQLVLRRRLLTQFALFVFLELAFIALALVCLWQPLPCSISPSPTFTKAIFTALFITWQMLANTCAQSVVYHGFSSEWYINFRNTGKLVPGHTDMVSTATSGYLNRFRYFFGRGCSLSYRLSFITSLTLVALAGLAPGSITVEDGQQFEPSNVTITNFTTLSSDGIIGRTQLIAELELRENMTFKFTTEEHVIVGWPSIEAGQLTGDIEFKSDVLFYNMTCWWEAPSFNTSQWNTTWYAGGFAWYPWATPIDGIEFDGGMMPMYRFSTDQEFIPHQFPNALPVVNPVGLQGYLFFGINSSLSGVSPKRRNLNLDGLPAMFSSSGYHFIDFFGQDGHFKSPLATFLLCNPHAHFLDGQVLLSQKSTSITLLSTSSPVNNQPQVGNISPDAANSIFAFGLMEVLKVEDDKAPMKIGHLAAQAFTNTNDTSQDFDRSITNSFDLGILSIDDIQQNLNFFMNSGGKALSSHSPTSKDDEADQVSSMPIQVVIQQDKQMLMTSQGLIIATTSLFFCVTLLLAISLFHLCVWKTPPFKLETLMDYIMRNDKETIPHLQDRHHSNQPSSQQLLMHLLGFILLELAFLSLVLFSSRNPILVKIPLTSAEVKGGFTVIFILWQTLAGSLLSDILLFVFSSEWWLQYTKTGQLIPGITDQVSRITSGANDKAHYFLTCHPSTVFSCAFMTSILLAILSTLAPGSLSVSKVKVAVGMPMKVADLQLVTSLQSDDNFNNWDFLQYCANTLILLEHQENSIFKYDMEPNWIMAWPDETSINPSVVGNVEYPTDVIHFDYMCTWRVPEMGSDNNATTWTIDGYQWKLWSYPSAALPYVGGIVPLYRHIDVQPDATFAILFIGTNDTLPVNSDQEKQSFINLNNLPTLFHPNGLAINRLDGTTSQWIFPLSSILICDPRLEVSGGQAQLTPNKKLSVVTSQLPPIGNMPHDAITTLFSTALPTALDTQGVTVPQWINPLSAQVFLTDSAGNFTAYPHGVPLLNLTSINNNMNLYLLSGSKAYLDGLYIGPSNQSNITTQMRSVIGSGEVEKQALVGDTTLGIVSVCLSTGCVVLFAVLTYLIPTNVRKTFNLQNLLTLLHVKADEFFNMEYIEQYNESK